MSKVVYVKLKAGHPTGTMYARLNNDRVIEVQREGVVTDADQVSESMTAHGWFEISDAAGGAEADGNDGKAEAKSEERGPKSERHRSAETGKIVTERFAKANPATTVKEAAKKKPAVKKSTAKKKGSK